jgi:hypothetical protein
VFVAFGTDNKNRGLYLIFSRKRSFLNLGPSWRLPDL